MECRPLDITILSAKDLKNVNFITKMDVYVVVSIEGGDPRMTQQTPVDKDAGKNPQWNFLMKFTLEEAAIASNLLTLVFTIMSERALGDRVIGHVHVPLKEFLDTSINSSGGTSGKTTSYVVRTIKGKEKGSLDFLYRFGEKYTYVAAPLPPAAVAPPSVKAADEPVIAYPAAGGAPGSSSSYTAYPPPGYAQPGYGYPPQQPGYGYPPQYPLQYPTQPGYGYPACQPVQKPQKKLGGAGLGLGLAGGLLGGLLIGDMISDVGDAAAYDAGYDAGFDDGFGF